MDDDFKSIFVVRQPKSLAVINKYYQIALIILLVRSNCNRGWKIIPDLFGYLHTVPARISAHPTPGRQNRRDFKGKNTYAMV